MGGIDPDYSRIEYLELCWRLSENTIIEQIQQPLYLYRVHRESICQTRQKEQIELTQKAILTALKRRGIDEQWEFFIQWQPKFILRQKN